jgi:hypothetical protein
MVIIITSLPRLEQGKDSKADTASDAKHQLQGKLGGCRNQKLTHP